MDDLTIGGRDALLARIEQLERIIGVLWLLGDGETFKTLTAEQHHTVGEIHRRLAALGDTDE